MQGAIPTTIGKRSLVGDLNQRYGQYLGLIIVALLGLVLLPALFHALADHDVLIGGLVSLINAVWLVVGLILSVVALRSYAAMKRVLRERLVSALDAIPELIGETGDLTTAADIREDASRSVTRLLDLVVLLIIQAMLRPPMIGVGKNLLPEAWIDGAYVVLVVLIALFILFSLRRASRPLIERLLWLGLNRVIPTAGFQTSSAAATFATRMTTTNASRSATPSRSAESPPPAAGADEGTVAAGIGAEATVLAPAIVTAEDTVLAPSPPAEAGAATMLAPAGGEGSEETILAPAEPPEAAVVADSTAVLPPERPDDQAKVINGRVDPGASQATVVLEESTLGKAPATSVEPPREGKR